MYFGALICMVSSSSLSKTQQIRQSANIKTNGAQLINYQYKEIKQTYESNNFDYRCFRELVSNNFLTDTKPVVP